MNKRCYKKDNKKVSKGVNPCIIEITMWVAAKQIATVRRRASILLSEKNLEAPLQKSLSHVSMHPENKNLTLYIWKPFECNRFINHILMYFFEFIFAIPEISSFWKRNFPHIQFKFFSVKHDRITILWPIFLFDPSWN